MHNSNTPSLKIMTKDDLRRTINWAKKEGWNPGKYEVEPLYQADPKGYRLLILNDEPIASLAGVKYTDNFAFLGLYIVKPEYRGKGYGKLLWDITLDALKECRTIGLNGIIDQVKIYMGSEFKPDTLNTRWKGHVSKSLLKSTLFATTENNIILKTYISFDKLSEYDVEISGISRPAFLSRWLTMPKAFALFAFEQNVFKGYGVISKATEGYKIAPLFADNEAIARILYVALCQRVKENSIIYLDTNESNPAATIFAKSLGLTKTFKTLRMYRGEVPTLDDKKIFGLTSLEIG